MSAVLPITKDPRKAVPPCLFCRSKDAVTFAPVGVFFEESGGYFYCDRFSGGCGRRVEAQANA